MLQASSQPPPRPQRPFTEYNVFFRLERELLLQGTPDSDAFEIEKSRAEERILSCGKEIESSDVAARRPQQYRHLIMAVDWMIVGSSTSCQADPSGKRASKRRKDADAKSKFTFLELTKLISSRWKEVCQNDPETKDFCKNIADAEAARYRADLEDYRRKYGVEAARGKKRKSRKVRPESLETTKQVKEEEEEEFDMLNNFVPVDEDLEEDFGPPQASNSDNRSHTIVPPLISMMYSRQQELQTRLERTQRKLASLPFSSSFTINTFQGIPKDFSHAHTFQGAVIAPSPPSAYLHAQAQEMQLQMPQNHYNNDDKVVEEYLHELERKVIQRQVKSSAYGGASGVRLGIDRNLYLQKFHRKCIAKTKSKWSPSQYQFHLAHSHSDVMNVTSSSATEAPKRKKFRRLQSWFENVEIKDAEDITA